MSQAYEAWPYHLSMCEGCTYASTNLPGFHPFQDGVPDNRYVWNVEEQRWTKVEIQTKELRQRSQAIAAEVATLMSQKSSKPCINVGSLDDGPLAVIARMNRTAGRLSKEWIETFNNALESQVEMSLFRDAESGHLTLMYEERNTGVLDLGQGDLISMTASEFGQIDQRLIQQITNEI